ncbi:hypothetical protein [Streptomyces pinistramenti]|nr:hypothetical protein [Streptomyces pinistramenti]
MQRQSGGLDRRRRVVSNAWPQSRTRMPDAGLLDIADAVFLSY